MSSVALKTVYFHGSLKEVIPEPIRMSGRSIREVLHGVVSQFPQLQRRLGNKYYPVRIEGVEKDTDLTNDTDQEEIHIYPTFDGGGGNGGLVQIAIGALLIATVIVAPHIGLGATMAAGIAGTTVGSVLVGVGISLILGGLLQLLSPTPEMDMGDNKEGSKYLGSPQNTVKIGTRIPLIFGTHKAYGHYLTFNIDAKDFSSKKNKDDDPSSKFWDTTWLWMQQDSKNEPQTEKSDPPQPPGLPPYVLWSGGNP